MGPAIVLILVAAACLSWSAACVAAACRVPRGWTRPALIALAIMVPVLAILISPLGRLTAFLLSSGFAAGVFAPPLATCLAATMGAIVIPIIGMSTRAGGTSRAAGWPAIVLFAVSLAAAAAAWRALVLVDDATLAEARVLRAEAARMIEESLPPAPPADDDAAPLYRRVCTAISADPAVSGPESPVAVPLSADTGSPEVVGILARHATTLDLLRQAADRPACRFEHDWSRPTIAMDLSAEAAMPSAARLLAVAARAEAAKGDVAAALADVGRIGRMASHVAETPLAMAVAVAVGLQGQAFEVLADVLPRLQPADAPLLAGRNNISALILNDIRIDRHAAGEQAVCLTTFADLAEGRSGGVNEDGDGADAAATPESLGRGRRVTWRCFMMPADLRFARRAYDRLAFLSRYMGDDVLYKFPVETTVALERRRPGLVSALSLPSGFVLARLPNTARARRHVAAALEALTRERLESGTEPTTLEAIAPCQLSIVPVDPFTADAPLRWRRSDDGWVVWSVGPDGEDDGGPPPPGSEPAAGNDDIGLRMAVSR